MKLPDVWMITIPNNKVSNYYYVRCKESWEKRGFNVRKFPAVTPNTLHRQQNRLEFNIKVTGSKKRNFSETEKAVWYSHYNAWRFAADLIEPIIIAEHDAYLTKKIPMKTFDNDLVSLSHSVGNPYAAGVCYYIKQSVAKKLIDVPVIDMNSDNWIHLNVDKYGVWDRSYVRHFRNAKVGFTIIHR